MNLKNKDQEFKIDENIAYFIGVLHSDGCIYVFNDKKRNRKQIRLNLTVGNKSIPMALKFKNILKDYFSKTVNLRKVPNKSSYVIQTSINRVWHIFQGWNSEKVPKEIKKNYILFGAYLAGLVDGDGHIKMKYNKDRIIPQCMIRISSDHPLKEIKYIIENCMSCKVHFEYKKGTKGVDTCFYISKKNIDFIENYVYPYITLPYKIKRLEGFFRIKKMSLPGVSE